MDATTLHIALPNWDRFCVKYQPNPVFTEAFITRISALENSAIRDSILKRINIELGILLLHDVEVGRDMFQIILESMQEGV